MKKILDKIELPTNCAAGTNPLKNAQGSIFKYKNQELKMLKQKSP
ncbi:hypothetical protein C8N25_11338 [Algoriphagus antarcticus]|uniref:Uncharacterized protein n=1 Tax=Algoriphagus antarcticus TaxID=238540 RepID=A0A3E0DQI6_9BACT|nr:hypothetical protein C8N25_11338 [Algoriphagus antarcticus]